MSHLLDDPIRKRQPRGRAKCRPFMFCFEREGKLWFCTGTMKDVNKDMQANPFIEVCVASPACAWLRLSGRAVFADDRAVKEACMENSIVKGVYGDAGNPVFAVFYLADAKAVIADFSGNSPAEYALWA